jgi:hypothetical protein
MAIKAKQERPSLTKECSLCGNAMPTGARKCSNCGNVFADYVEASSKVATDGSSEKLGNLVVALPIVGSIAALLWISRLSVLSNPLQKLEIVGCLVIAISTILVVLEVATSPKKRDGTGLENLGPVAWFLLLLVFWPVALPLYMKTREKHRRKNLFYASITSVALFVSAVSIAGVISVRNQSLLLSEIDDSSRLIESTMAVPTPASQPTPEIPEEISESKPDTTALVIEPVVAPIAADPAPSTATVGKLTDADVAPVIEEAANSDVAEDENRRKTIPIATPTPEISFDSAANQSETTP